MIVKQLELLNFRNYRTLVLQPDSGTNIFYGDNAQGKTNILESIYVGSTAKSHRSSRDRELIHFDEEEAHIKMLLEKNEAQYRIDMHLKKTKAKGIAVNGVPVRRISELLGLMNVIFFSPEDLGIIKKGPAERRKFMDVELCQLDKIYTDSLMNYNRVLVQRNKLLKEISFKPELEDTLDIWDIHMVHYGKSVIGERSKFVDDLNEIIEEIHSSLTAGKETLKLVYEPDVREDELEEALVRGRERDLKQKISYTGPHKDDICFLVNGIDIRKYGSQGQQRTAALSLKLSEIALVRKITGDDPVLLLDDVLSELDSSRQIQLLNHIEKIQTMITCTGLDEFVNCRFPIDRIFHVSEGTVELMNDRHYSILKGENNL